VAASPEPFLRKSPRSRGLGALTSSVNCFPEYPSVSELRFGSLTLPEAKLVRRSTTETIVETITKNHRFGTLMSLLMGNNLQKQLRDNLCANSLIFYYKFLEIASIRKII
jgi:hypothetical protein